MAKHISLNHIDYHNPSIEPKEYNTRVSITGERHQRPLQGPVV